MSVTFCRVQKEKLQLSDSKSKTLGRGIFFAHGFLLRVVENSVSRKVGKLQKQVRERRRETGKGSQAGSLGAVSTPPAGEGPASPPMALPPRRLWVARSRPLTAVFCLLADVYFIATLSFLWKVSVITLVSCLPLYVLKYLRRRFSPPSYSKLTS